MYPYYFFGLLLLPFLFYVAFLWFFGKDELCPGPAPPPKPTYKGPTPISVNYHFTRHCNAECGFCFHTEKTSFRLDIEEAKRGLVLLRDAGMRKLNFAGGEPFLYPKTLGYLCKFVKEELGLESVSIVSNGTKIQWRWMEEYAQYVDILAISCDSFNKATNRAIGRAERTTGKPFDNVSKLFQIKDWCEELGVRFKLNTVVCALNWEEDMVEMVKKLRPFRWKVFQVLVVVGENDDGSDKRKGEAKKFIITDGQFQAFCDRHKELACLVPEPNQLMASTYLILDEYMRFLDKGEGEEKHSESILKVGVAKALSQVRWDREGFIQRGGIYDWSKEVNAASGGCGTSLNSKELEW